MRSRNNHRADNCGSSPNGASSRMNHRAETCDGRHLRHAECSAELVKQTLEDTFKQVSLPQKSLLARQLGFDSFEDLVAASTVATLSDGSRWWLTADRFGAWTAWNLCALEFPPSYCANETATPRHGDRL
jgi:hypothetical protein